MYTWLINNIGTVLISLGLVTILVGVVVYMIREKKKGKCTCGKSCSTCGECPYKK